MVITLSPDEAPTIDHNMACNHNGICRVQQLDVKCVNHMFCEIFDTLKVRNSAQSHLHCGNKYRWFEVISLHNV